MLCLLSILFLLLTAKANFFAADVFNLQPINQSIQHQKYLQENPIVCREIQRKQSSLKRHVQERKKIHEELQEVKKMYLLMAKSVHTLDEKGKSRLLTLRELLADYTKMSGEEDKEIQRLKEQITRLKTYKAPIIIY